MGETHLKKRIPTYIVLYFIFFNLFYDTMKYTAGLLPPIIDIENSKHFF